jgi:hypothetical protein
LSQVVGSLVQSKRGQNMCGIGYRSENRGKGAYPQTTPQGVATTDCGGCDLHRLHCSPFSCSAACLCIAAMFLRSPICSEQGPRACGFFASKFPGHSGFFRRRLYRANERVASGLAVVDLHRLVNTETAHRTRSGCGASRIIAATRGRPVRGAQILPPGGALQSIAGPTATKVRTSSI